MGQTLQNWSRSFWLVKTTLESETFLARVKLAAQKLFMRTVQAYKTPGKELPYDSYDARPPKKYNPFVPNSEEDAKYLAIS